MAVALWRATLAVNPANPSTMFMYGEALTHVAGREEEVEFYYKEVLMRQPAHVRCMTNYGLLISRDAARHAEAERIYEFAIARTQSKDFNDLPYVPAHIMTNLANLYIKMGDLGRAETMYNRALGVLPTHPQAGCNLAIVLVHLRRVAEARHRLGEVMRHNPEYTDCIANFESTLKSAHV